MKTLLKSIALVCLVLLVFVPACLSADITPAPKDKFVAGFAFGDPEIEGPFDLGGNEWIKFNPEGTYHTNTGGATTPSPYGLVFDYICYGTEIAIDLELPVGTKPGTYLVRFLVCENWWADDELHRVTYNLELNGKVVDTNQPLPVNKGDILIKEYEATIGADGILSLLMTAGEGGGTDTNLILSGIEVVKK